MKTEGNPVDSVIQYQLHKKSEGGGGGSVDCKVKSIEIISEIEGHICTQEDIDNYGYDSSYQPLVLGELYGVETINHTYETFEAGNVYINSFKNAEEIDVYSIIPSYGKSYVEDVGMYIVTIYDINGDETMYYAKKDNIQLCKFSSDGGGVI